MVVIVVVAVVLIVVVVVVLEAVVTVSMDFIDFPWFFNGFHCFSLVSLVFQ